MAMRGEVIRCAESAIIRMARAIRRDSHHLEETSLDWHVRSWSCTIASVQDARGASPAVACAAAAVQRTASRLASSLIYRIMR